MTEEELADKILSDEPATNVPDRILGPPTKEELKNAINILERDLLSREWRKYKFLVRSFGTPSIRVTVQFNYST